MEKHALLINGDLHSGLSGRHAENMKILGDFLSGAGYRVIKVEGETATRETLSRLLEGMRGKMDGDDDLFLYVTGHGSMEGGLECAVVDDGIPVALKWIDEQTRSLKYKERVVWLDGCYSGGALRYFSEDPKTLFVAAGSKDETVGCFHFTPPAFEQGTDLNRDGIISFGERFVAGAENVRAKGADFSPIYFAGRDYEDNGVSEGKNKPRFEAGVVSVSDPAGLKKELARFQPGEYAVVDFSASWCGPCQAYKPEFEKMAKEDGGKHLWIRAEGEGEPWGEWEIAHYPTVKIFRTGDPVGYEVSERENPLEEILSSLEDPSARKKQTLENIVSQMEYGQVLKIKKAVKKLARLVEDRKVSSEDLVWIFHGRPGARVGIIQTLQGVRLSPQEEVLWEARLTFAALEDPDEWVRKAAVEALPRELWNMKTRSPMPGVRERKRIIGFVLINDPSIHVRNAAAGKLRSYSFFPEEGKELIGKIGEGIRSGYFGPVGPLDLLMKFSGYDPQRVEALLFDFLSHPDWLVRREASHSIEMYSDNFRTNRTVLRKFATQLQKMVDSDPVEEVRYAAASALVAGLGEKDPSVVPVLVDEMKATGSRLYLWLKENRDNMNERSLESFRESLGRVDFRNTMAIRALGSMGAATRGCIPDLIEEILVYPRDTGKMEDILEAIFAIDPDGAPEHFKTIESQSTSSLVHISVERVRDSLSIMRRLK